MKYKFNKFTEKILNKLNNNYSNILNKNELENDYDLDYTHNNHEMVKHKQLYLSISDDNLNCLNDLIHRVNSLDKSDSIEKNRLNKLNINRANTYDNKKYDKKYNINDINNINDNDKNDNNKNQSDQFDIIYKDLKSSKLYKNDQIYDIYSQNILGKGSFCKVYSGKLDGNDIAIKIFVKHKSRIINRFHNEIMINEKLSDSPYIIKILGFDLNNYYIFNELMVCDIGLYCMHHPKKANIPFRFKLEMAVQMIKGIEKMHLMNMIHCDIKPYNYLINHKFQIKLGDFGLSYRTSIYFPDADTMVGTPLWMAPEIMNNGLYTQKVDIYSFGMTLWAIINGAEPFPNMNKFDEYYDHIVINKNRPSKFIVHHIQETQIDLPIPINDVKIRNNIPVEYAITNILNEDFENLWSILESCWDENPVKRPNSTNIIIKLDNLIEKIN